MKKNIFKVNFIRLRNNENTYGFVRAFTVDDAKQIIINEIAQGNASLIKITSVKTVSEKEFEDAMNS
jgi:hypothetical protein